MDASRVAVLVVSYNAKDYIEKTLKSCLNQTYRNIEVLLLDNNSKDETVAIAQAMAEKDSRLKILTSEVNLGPYGGLNCLLEKTDAPYVAIQDHDDIWMPEKIEKQVDFLNKHSEYIGCGTQTYYYFESKEILICTPKLFDVDFVDHTSIMYRNTGQRYVASHSFSDEYFEKKTLAAQGKIACLEDKFLIHRIKRGGGNLTYSRFKFQYKCIKDFLEVYAFFWSGAMVIVSLFIHNFISEQYLWWIRRKITFKNSEWISTEDFQKQHPNLDFFVI